MAWDMVNRYTSLLPCSIAGRDWEPLGERHEALARRWSGCKGFRGVHSNTPSLNACMGQDEEIFLAKSRPSPYLSEVLCIYLLLLQSKGVAQKGVSSD
jgi:hypothetical protein